MGVSVFLRSNHYHWSNKFANNQVLAPGKECVAELAHDLSEWQGDSDGYVDSLPWMARASGNITNNWANPSSAICSGHFTIAKIQSKRRAHAPRRRTTLYRITPALQMRV
uniref:Uncharacterized protein n=1 Tax=Candidatus Kentrum eta TaxID=2126337 RepID=A0A450UKW9_9GAMM|nr:MAG: hypothetical protein BECKH772A_GA0070896_1005310 [Candidatus Kentron sp. H]VFJ94041.1 MAG: hypothetical protein BECKH772B_GA0070898_1005410 [Candidatus Kentron sp. H]VFK00705.1 MAG: hypothetical protein BECKH772C_GA0070978_1005110 [Candidatus Kentron sp. H]